MCLAYGGNMATTCTALAHKSRRSRWHISQTRWYEQVGEGDREAELKSGASLLTIDRLDNRAQVTRLRTEAVEAANRVAGQDDRAAQASWRSWLHEGPGCGIGRQHRMSRTATGWVPSAVGDAGFHLVYDDNGEAQNDDDIEDGKAELFADDGGRLLCSFAQAVPAPMPLGNQEAVEAEAAKWAQEWDVSGSPPRPVWPLIVHHGLPPVTADLMRRACRRFPVGTGLGWDRLHPRA